MILIITVPEDQSSSDVIEWIGYYDGKFKRVSSRQLVDESHTLMLDNEKYSFSKHNQEFRIKAVWLRRLYYKPNVPWLKDEKFSETQKKKLIT